MNVRITNNMMVANTVRNINSNASRLSKAQDQMSSQSKIQLPSDDPVVASRAIKYRSYVAKIEQYQKNTDNAVSWQEVTDNALSDLGDVVQQIRDYTVQASSDTLTDEDKAKIKTNVEELKKQAVQIMNTSYGGRYVFGGYVTDQEPYQIEATDMGDKVTFKGSYLGGLVSASLDDTAITDFYTDNAVYTTDGAQSIQYNLGYSNSITINVEGQDAIGESSANNLFDTIDKLLLGLNGESSYKTVEVTTDPTTTVSISTSTLDLDSVLTDLDHDLDRLLTARSDLGARMNYVNMTKDRLSTDYNTYTKLMSNNEDIDTAEVSMAVSTAEYVYEASLSVGAKVISNSLVDYLR
ncbi:flagellar hook-associated protein 3 [Sporomusaceae bacterium FL31]|nr:flagellar hook-associated protein 3 [Sporomusaceae bacterium FL31]GCE35207.1 flagellar hook-associated protein 3 [Sporomusaceae bacterium]